MSDALCGPSNALQNFQKHASVDRTLQQDRLSSRQSPAQGFRSQSPRDGILDPEFAAFEANLGGAALPDLQHPAHFHAPVQAHAASNASSGWASDFQNLHISGPPAPQLQRPNVAQAQGGWQNEFMNQQQRAPAHHMQAMQAHPATNRAFQPAFAPSYPMYNTPMNAHQAPQQAHSEPSASVQQFDESAFEAAFEQAHADMELQAVTPEIEQHMHDTNQVGMTEPTQEEFRIGSDNIAQSDKQNIQSQTRDADALAQTAGQLLDSVRHEQSEKFQQSNFLALMRRIRDREVEVKGDEFRETTQSLHPLHPGGPYYPAPLYSGHSAAPVDSQEDTLELGRDAFGEEESPRLGTNPYGPGDSNGLYEGWYHSEELVDRRRPTFCFHGEDQIW